MAAATLALGRAGASRRWLRATAVVLVRASGATRATARPHPDAPASALLDR